MKLALSLDIISIRNSGGDSASAAGQYLLEGGTNSLLLEGGTSDLLLEGDPLQSLTLTWDEVSSNDFLGFDLSGLTGLAENDVIRLTIDSTDYDNTVSAEELADLFFAFSTGALANDTYSGVGYHLRSGDVIAYSNTESATVNDTTDPVLSSPTDTVTGDTTATGTVTTDTDTGTLYAVVTTSSTPPSAAQVKAGQNHLGAAAADADSQAITSTGSKSFSFSGLTASTAYYTYYMHEDIGPNQSTVSAADGFTTHPANPFTYIGTQQALRSLGTTSNATFTLEFGASGACKAVVGIATYGSATKPICDIDGATMTKIFETVGAAGSSGMAMYELELASGGSRTLTVDPQTAAADVVIGYGYLTGMAAAASTRYDFHNPSGSASPRTLFNASSGNGSGTQAVPTNGCGVVFGFEIGSFSTAITLSSVTQHCDTGYDGTGIDIRIAVGSVSVDVDPVMSWSGTPTMMCGMAAWGP